MRRRVAAAAALALAATALALGAAQTSSSAVRTTGAPTAAQGVGELARVKHVVVIYEENHSFDNLYGGWEGVNGRSSASSAAAAKQVNQGGTAFDCLKQLDVNLASPPLAVTCTDTTTGTSFSSAFPNAPFEIDSYIPATAKTCPAQNVFGPANGILDPNGLPGGCTRDLVHRYYQEQFQLDGGSMDRYVQGSDALGLVMGYYDTQSLPIYEYLHRAGHPHYAIADDFFQAAFGGSFLNHQWLVAAATPVFAGAPNDGSANDLHSIVDANGMPTTYPLYSDASTHKDSSLTASCDPPAGTTPAGVVCGDYAVNTTQPWYWPYSPGTADAKRLPPLTNPTIGDELTAKGVSWAWYSGGWDNATGNRSGLGWTNGPGPNCSDPNVNTNVNVHYPNCPDGTFQFHHQAFDYYASFAPGTAQRTDDLRDEADFLAAAKASTKTCALRDVSFVKPLGVENEHPGYASEPNGSDHLVDLVDAVEGSACAKDTMIVVTYDEFGGQWDHVPPPGQGGAPGPHDEWGPGTRIPALVISADLKAPFAVDHTQYDTTSILATIERRFKVAPLGTRDAQVADLSHVFGAAPVAH
jgi:acid phosphatase